MIERNHHPAGRVFNMLFGLCQVADGFIRVLSLGYLHSRLNLTASRKATEKLIYRRKSSSNIQKNSRNLPSGKNEEATND